MQTFLPYPEFSRSAAVLDYRRLGKQRVETFQLLRGLLGVVSGSGWRNHPASIMWRGYEPALAQYGIAVCDEWIRRGYKDTCREKIGALVSVDSVVLPAWLGDEKLHASHRSNLLRKDSAHYGKFGWLESADIPYFWPVENS